MILSLCQDEKLYNTEKFSVYVILKILSIWLILHDQWSRCSFAANNIMIKSFSSSKPQNEWGIGEKETLRK